MAKSADPEASAARDVVIDLTDPSSSQPTTDWTIDLTDGRGAQRPRPQALTFGMTPRALLVLVNALNVLDATLTIIWIELRMAVEANPVVDAMGFPAKVLGVAVGSYVVYRLAPRWLAVPAVALSGVCVYHIAGAMWTLGAL